MSYVHVLHADVGVMYTEYLGTKKYLQSKQQRPTNT